MTLRDFLRRCDVEARAALASISVGIAIALLFAVGSGARNIFAYIFHGALTGLLISLSIEILHGLLRARIERIQPSAARTAAQVAVLIVGGAAGWLAGMAFALQRFSDVVGARWMTFALVTIAIVVGVGLLLRSFSDLNARLREREWTEKELHIARSIQERLLPPPEIEGPGYAISARNLPAQIVAGDFYDFVRRDDGSIVIVVADVAGKGIGASLIMASVKAVLPFIAQKPVAEAMTALNDKLVRELDRREFVALAYARFDPERGSIEVANAGFPDPYLLRNGSASPLSVGGVRLPLGVRRDVQYQTLDADVAHGDRVLFVSDGIPEAMTREGESLGYDELTTMAAQIDELDTFLDRVRERVGNARSDDWTAVLIERR
ncbi:MAG TPA: SpoIIE family protein phosphatase [Thermoanaerobaculia bacterium]